MFARYFLPFHSYERAGFYANGKTRTVKSVANVICVRCAMTMTSDCWLILRKLEWRRWKKMSTMCLAVLTEAWNVTDKKMDRQTGGNVWIASLISRFRKPHSWANAVARYNMHGCVTVVDRMQSQQYVTRLNYQTVKAGQTIRYYRRRETSVRVPFLWFKWPGYIQIHIYSSVQFITVTTITSSSSHDQINVVRAHSVTGTRYSCCQTFTGMLLLIINFTGKLMNFLMQAAA